MRKALAGILVDLQEQAGIQIATFKTLSEIALQVGSGKYFGHLTGKFSNLSILFLTK